MQGSIPAKDLPTTADVPPPKMSCLSLVSGLGRGVPPRCTANEGFFPSRYEAVKRVDQDR